MTRRTFTPEFKRKIVEEHFVGGRTIADICREYHLCRNLFDNWRKAYHQAAVPVPLLHLVAGDSGKRVELDFGKGTGRPLGTATAARVRGLLCTKTAARQDRSWRAALLSSHTAGPPFCRGRRRGLARTGYSRNGLIRGEDGCCKPWSRTAFAQCPKTSCWPDVRNSAAAVRV